MHPNSLESSPWLSLLAVLSAMRIRTVNPGASRRAALCGVFTVVACLQGEDWEYEDDRADDDQEMGRDEDADMPAPRRHVYTPAHPATDPVACYPCC
jgi:hypothetical protein